MSVVKKKNDRIALGPKYVFCAALVTIAVIFAFALESTAGVTVYKEGDKYVTLGGRIQLQYHMEDPDTGSPSDKSTDEL